MTGALLEGLFAIAAVGKAWAFPTSAVLLCLYPVIILAWTAIEGAQSSVPKAPSRADVEGQKAPNLSKPQAGRRRGALLIVALAAAALASGSAFAVAAHRRAGAVARPAPQLTAPPAAPGGAEATATGASPMRFAAGAFAVAAIASLLRRPTARQSSATTAATHVVPVTAQRPVAASSSSTTVTSSDPLVLPEGVARYVAPAPAGYSLWHDVDLHVRDWLDDETTGVYNYVNEMPMGSLQKFEVQPHLQQNAIEEDVKGSKKLAAFGRPVPFNYGCLPQTYRDPDELDEVHNAPGDDDPLDIFDLGDKVAGVGEVLTCRPIGAVCLIDEGQADWKVLAVSTGHGGPLSEARSIEDVERIVPGRVAECLAWLDDLKGNGKGDAKLHAEIHGAEFARKLIERDHGSWKALIAEAGDSGAARGHWVRKLGATSAPAPVEHLSTLWPFHSKGKNSSLIAGVAKQYAEYAHTSARATSPTSRRSGFPSSP